MIRYHAEWVVPVTSEPLRHGTVVEHDGRIVYVGARAAAPRGEDVDLGHAIICPGLVNTHCHLELTVMRGFLEDLSFRDWILRLTTAKRSVLSRDDLLDSARLGIAEGLRAGVTSYADTGDSGVAFDAMLELGVRGVMYQQVFGPDPAQCAESMRELDAKIVSMRPRGTSLVTLGISPHAPYTVSDRLFAAVAAYAGADRLPVAVHIAESAVESALIADGTGAFADGLRARGIDVARRARSPVALLDETGLLAVQPLLIHAVRTDAADIRLMKARGAPVAHCPVSNAKLGHGRWVRSRSGRAPISPRFTSGTGRGCRFTIQPRHSFTRLPDARQPSSRSRARYSCEMVSCSGPIPPLRRACSTPQIASMSGCNRLRRPAGRFRRSLRRVDRSTVARGSAAGLSSAVPHCFLNRRKYDGSFHRPHRPHLAQRHSRRLE